MVRPLMALSLRWTFWISRPRGHQRAPCHTWYLAWWQHRAVWALVPAGIGEACLGLV